MGKISWSRVIIVVISSVATLALLWDSVVNNRDIPSGWLTLIVLVWSAELGVREVGTRWAERALEKKEKEEKSKREANKDELGETSNS